MFWFNTLIASNGTDRRIGSVTEDRERFFEWKRIERENELGQVSLLVIVYESYPERDAGYTRWPAKARRRRNRDRLLQDTCTAVGGCSAPAGSRGQPSRRSTARLGHADEFNRIEPAGVVERARKSKEPRFAGDCEDPAELVLIADLSGRTDFVS